MKILNDILYEKHIDDLRRMIEHFNDNDKRSNDILNNLKRFISDGSAITAGHIIDDKLVSFIWCYVREFDGLDRMHISYFIVDEKFRGRGYSKDLINFAINITKENNISLIDLNVDESNEIALQLYQNSGFEIEKLQLVLDLSKEKINVQESI